MIPVNGSSFGRAGGRLRRYPGGTENASIFATVRGRSQTAAPLPAGSDPQSEPHNEPEHRAPRPSSPGPCRLRQRPLAAGFSPAQPGYPAASVRDFCSGAFTRPMVRMNRPIGPFWRAKTCSTAERTADLRALARAVRRGIGLCPGLRVVSCEFSKEFGGCLVGEASQPGAVVIGDEGEEVDVTPSSRREMRRDSASTQVGI